MRSMICLSQSNLPLNQNSTTLRILALDNWFLKVEKDQSLKLALIQIIITPALYSRLTTHSVVMILMDLLRIYLSLVLLKNELLEMGLKKMSLSKAIF